MAFMDWSESLSVGVASIDEQHKKLVGMINDLHTAVEKGQGAAVLGKTLDGLIDYTKTHFGYEEELFAKTGYPIPLRIKWNTKSSWRPCLMCRPNTRLAAAKRCRRMS